MAASACADPATVVSEGSSTEGVGSLGLALQLAPDVVIDTIKYEITGPGVSLTGTLQVPGVANLFSASIGGIPAGQGYQIRLTSVANGDAGLACAGSAPFDVLANATTQVNVALLCDTQDTTGGVAINGSFNVCPSVTSTAVTPLLQYIGRPIVFSSAAHDVDQGPGTITYLWTSANGPLVNATTSSPTFTCTQAGLITVHYEVSDGSCSKEGTLTATCAGTGDPTLDAGTPAPKIVINEVESNGGSPDDWVELFNAGSQPTDISGWGFRDNDATHAVFRVPAGTTIAPGGYYVLDTQTTSTPAGFPFGLGSADSAILYAADGTSIVDSYSWTAHAASTYGRCPNGTGAFAQSTSSKGAENVCGSATDAGLDGGGSVGVDAGKDAGASVQRVVINEVESNGGSPDDWVELYNAGSASVDVSSWGFRDNDATHAVFRIPAGTTIAPGGYYVLDTQTTSTPTGFPFGLGSADSALLYGADGITIVDTYSWTAHATSTFGRCPNGTGEFAQTTSSKGAANICSPAPDGGVQGTDAGSDAGISNDLPWPGPSTVLEVDAPMAFASNLSGLSYQAGATVASSVLWGVQNGPSMLYRLHDNGTLFVSTTDNDWGAGKTIRYPAGTGAPDSEGVVYVPGASAGVGVLYVSTERDNNSNGTSRLSVLQFDANAPGTVLNALHEWNLTSDLPAVGPNLGLEGITFVSDAELAAQSFREGSGQPYNAGRFAQHGGGVFLVGVEGTGFIHIYALNHADNSYLKLASFSSGMSAVMDLAYDPDTNYLWAYGDDTQGNRSVLFEIESNMASLSYGQFVQRKVLAKPAGLPPYNNEGISFAPDSECTAGLRSFFWADDGADNGHSLRRGSIPCGHSY